LYGLSLLSFFFLAIVLMCLSFFDLRGPGWLNELGNWIT